MNNLFSGMVWKFVERIAAQLVSFLVSVILARILMPEQYGIIAKVTVFIAIADVFVSVGLGSALVQKKDSDDLDFSSIFCLDMVMSIILYGILFAMSPYISYFFNDPDLTNVLRVLGIKLLFSAYMSIQQAYISRHMIFRASAIVTFIATVCSAVVGIIMAHSGKGVWALVSQQLTMSVSQVLLLTLILKWRPRIQFSWKRSKEMLTYGNLILLAGILDTISSQFRTLIVGKFYTDEELAYYNRGDLYPQTLIGSISGTMHTVLFAAYSKEQKNLTVIKAMVRKGIQRGSFLVFTMLTGLAMVAEPFVRLMLTEKWMPCVPFLQIGCIGYATWVIQIVEQEAIQGLGYAKDYLLITMVRVMFNLIAVFILARYGVMAIAMGAVATSFLSSFLVCRWTYKHLHYNIKEQIQDLSPAIFVSICIAVAVSIVSRIPLPDLTLLILEIFAGIGVCIVMCVLTKNEAFYWIIYKIKDTLKNLISRKVKMK